MDNVELVVKVFETQVDVIYFDSTVWGHGPVASSVRLQEMTYV